MIELWVNSTFEVPAGLHTTVFVLSGEAVLNDGEIIPGGIWPLLEREGIASHLKRHKAKVLCQKSTGLSDFRIVSNAVAAQIIFY